MDRRQFIIEMKDKVEDESMAWTSTIYYARQIEFIHERGDFDTKAGLMSERAICSALYFEVRAITEYKAEDVIGAVRNNVLNFLRNDIH